MEKIGVVGLGRMGSAIAERLAAEGLAVTGWTRSGRSAEGIATAPDLAALVGASDTLILSLYDDAAVAEVLDALLALDLTGRLVADTSTVIPDILKSRIAGFEARGAMAVDAPISGGPELVRAGACGIFLGGSDAAAARALPVLRQLTERVFHVGPLGTGLVMKTLNNGMLQVYTNGLRDLLPMARRAGLPLETALTILSGGPAGIPMVRDRMPKILGHDPEVGFPISAVFKDGHVFRRVVASFGLDTPMLQHFARCEPEMAQAGLMDADVAAMIRHAYDSGAE